MKVGQGYAPWPVLHHAVTDVSSRQQSSVIVTCGLSNAVHQFGNRHAQGVREAFDLDDADVTPAAFDLAQVAASHAGPFGKITLRQTPLLAQLPKASGEPVKDRTKGRENTGSGHWRDGQEKKGGVAWHRAFVTTRLRLLYPGVFHPLAGNFTETVFLVKSSFQKRSKKSGPRKAAQEKRPKKRESLQTILSYNLQADPANRLQPPQFDLRRPS